jgi:hypothetical protein
MEINNSPIYGTAAATAPGKEQKTNVSVQAFIRATLEEKKGIQEASPEENLLRVPDENTQQAARDTAKLQTTPYKVDDAFLVELSKAAQELEDSNAANRSAQQVTALASLSASGGYVTPSGKGSDAATAAFGNSVDITT